MRNLPAALLLAALAVPSAAAASAPQVEEGKQLVQDLEEKRAVEVLEAVTGSPTASAEDKAEAHLWIGIARVNLLEFDAAKESFRQALKASPAIKVPPTASPKAQRLFADAQAELAPKETPKEPPPAPVAAVTAPAEPARGTLTTAAYVTGGVGAAALIGGVIFGLSSSGSQEAAASATDGAVAVTELDSAKSSAGLANGMYIGGAVLLAGGAALWILDMPKPGASGEAPAEPKTGGGEEKPAEKPAGEKPDEFSSL